MIYIIIICLIIGGVWKISRKHSNTKNELSLSTKSKNYKPISPIMIKSITDFNFKKFCFVTKNDLKHYYKTTKYDKFLDIRYNPSNDIMNNKIICTNDANSTKNIKYAGSQSSVFIRTNEKFDNGFYFKVKLSNLEKYKNPNGEIALWVYFKNKSEMFSYVIVLEGYGTANKKETGKHIDTSTNISYFGTIVSDENSKAISWKKELSNNARTYEIIISKDYLIKNKINAKDFKMVSVSLSAEIEESQSYGTLKFDVNEIQLGKF